MGLHAYYGNSFFLHSMGEICLLKYLYSSLKESFNISVVILNKYASEVAMATYCDVGNYVIIIKFLDLSTQAGGRCTRRTFLP
jgi:hypothetical protein